MITTISGVCENLEAVKKLINLKKSADFAKCIEVARAYFEEFFNHKIQTILRNFPPDHVNPYGERFWSGLKRAPTPITFDPSDPLHA